MQYRLIGILIVLFICPVGAYEYSWVDTSGGLFTDPFNWDPPGYVPGSDDIALFETGSPDYVVSLTEPVTIDEFHVDGDTLTFFIALPDIIFATTGDLIISGYDISNLTLLGGIFNCGADVRLGIGIDGWSNLTVQHSELSVAGIFWAGFGDSLPVNLSMEMSSIVEIGELLMVKGDLLVDDSSLTVNTDLYMGYYRYPVGGDIRNGATVSAVDLFMARESGADATLTIQGASTECTVTDRLRVGTNGNAGLFIGDSATVSCARGAIAKNAGSWGEVEVDGGTWTISSNLAVGGDDALAGGDGSLIITSGMIDVTGPVQIWGSAFLEIPGGTLTADSINVEHGGVLILSGGNYSLGVLNLGGGTVSAPVGIDLDSIGVLSGNGFVDGDVYGGSAAVITADGELTMGDSTSANGFEIGGTLNVGGNTVELLDSDFALLGSSTTLEAGAVLIGINGLRIHFGESLNASGAAVIASNMTSGGTINGPVTTGDYLEIQGNLLGGGSYTGNIRLLARYNPAASPNQISFDGNLELAGTSTVVMELNGTAPGTGHDQLVITDTFTSDGTLSIVLMTGYTPAAGNAYTLFDSGSYSGSFDTLDLPALGPGLEWDVSLLATAGEIRVVDESAVTPTPEPSTPTPEPSTPTPEPPTPTPTPECLHHGDVNFSGTLTAADAQDAFNIILGYLIPTYEEECAADCNGSGAITAADSQAIFLAVLGLDQCVDNLSSAQFAVSGDRILATGV